MPDSLFYCSINAILAAFEQTHFNQQTRLTTIQLHTRQEPLIFPCLFCVLIFENFAFLWCFFWVVRFVLSIFFFFFIYYGWSSFCVLSQISFWGLMFTVNYDAMLLFILQHGRVQTRFVLFRLVWLCICKLNSTPQSTLATHTHTQTLTKEQVPITLIPHRPSNESLSKRNQIIQINYFVDKVCKEKTIKRTTLLKRLSRPTQEQKESTQKQLLCLILRLWKFPTTLIC